MFKKFREISGKIAQQEWQQVLSQKDIPTPVSGDQPTLSGLVNRVTLSGVVLVEQGVIQDVFPFLRLYKVSISGGPIIVCTYAADSTSSNFGVQDQTTLTVGTAVWVLRNPGSPYGAIFAVQPEFLTVPGMRHADEVVSGSNVGYISDSLYRTILRKKPTRGGMPYWEGSHLDSIPGEWAKIAHTGVGIFADPFLAGIRINEFCGMWANYFDSLIRITGLNYQKWTGGSEENEYIDWDKFVSYKGYAYTISGQAGMKDARGDQFFDLGEYNESSQLRASVIEPRSAVYGETATSSRFPVHNRQIWGGIVGQGGLEFVTASKRISDRPAVPVSKVQIATTASGFHVVQADQGILLAKYPLIPSVVRAADFDEELYDNEGKCVDRANDVIPKLLAGTPVCSLSLFNIATRNLHDIRNYLCNWEALAGVYAYINKFKILNENRVRGIKRIKVRDAQQAGSGTAYIYMDPEGNIALENTKGARIELVGEDIRITAPGKIIIDSGKKVAVFSKKTELFGNDQAFLSTEKRGIEIKKEELKIHADFLYGKTAQMDSCMNDPFTVNELYQSGKTPLDIPTQPWIYYYDYKKTKHRAADDKYRGPITLVKDEGYCRNPQDFPDIDLENSTQVFGGMNILQAENSVSEKERWEEGKEAGWLYLHNEQQENQQEDQQESQQ